MRALLLALLLAGPALAGCLESAPRGPALVVEPSGAPTDARGAGEAWVVQVKGREELRRQFGDPHAVCSIVFDHSIGEGVLRYSASRYPDAPEAPRVVVAFSHFDDGDCPLAYEVDFAPRGEATMGAYGALVVDVADDGALTVGGERVPLGQQARVAYERVVDGRTRAGEFTVTNLGAWPQDRIVAVGY